MKPEEDESKHSTEVLFPSLNIESQNAALLCWIFQNKMRQIFREWEYWWCHRSSLHDMCGEISCHMWAVGGQKWRLCFQTDLEMKPGRPHVLEDERVTDRHHKNRDSWSTEVNRLKGKQNLQTSNIFYWSGFISSIFTPKQISNSLVQFWIDPQCHSIFQLVQRVSPSCVCKGC